GAVLAVWRRPGLRAPAVRPQPDPPPDGKADPAAGCGLGTAEPGVGRILPDRGRPQSLRGVFRPLHRVAVGQLQGLRPDGPDGGRRDRAVAAAGQAHPGRAADALAPRLPARQALIPPPRLLPAGARAPELSYSPPCQTPPTASP